MKKLLLISLCANILIFPVWAEVQKPIDKIYLDSLAFKTGFAFTDPGVNHTNGGISGLNYPDENGTAYSVSAVFNNEYFPFLKPYVDYNRISYDDRNFNIYSIGARHDRFIDDANTWEWFISGGIGRGYSYWTSSPAPAAASGLAGDESFVTTVQTGVDWYFTPSWALSMGLRYDLYNMDTTVVQNSQVTTITDGNSLTAQAGIVYRFGQRGRYDLQDNDGDGVPNYLDKCLDTLANVPVDGHGCPQSTFLFNLSYQFAQFQLENLLDKPNFAVVKFLQKHPEYSVHINGYADSTGPQKFNQKLSHLRAKTAADKLIAKGIASARISYEGKGQTFPLLENDSASHREQNRRIEAIFYKAKARADLTHRVEKIDTDAVPVAVTPAEK